MNYLKFVWNRINLFLVFFIFIIRSTSLVQAGVFELSGTFSYSQSKLSDISFEWERHWGASLGYFFFESSEIEFALQDILNRTMISGIEDFTYHDQISSVDWVQSLTSRRSILQPYFKLGVGMLQRTVSGSFLGQDTTPEAYRALTVVMGAGLRIMVLRTLSLRAEATSYLDGGVLSTWQKNFSISGGASIRF